MADEEGVLDNMKRLGLDPKWSDMTIICQRQQFKCHKAIVARQSPVIDKELSSDFRESNGIIQHDEYSLETVERMIKFFYTGDYDDILTPHDSATAGNPVTDSLIAHANVHAIASYYGIDKLKIKAVEKTESILQTRIPKHEEANFVTLLEVIYKQPKSEDAGLRPLILTQAQYHLDYLIRDEHLINDFRNNDNLSECCFEITARLFSSLKTAADLLETEKTAFRRQISEKDNKLAGLASHFAQEEKRANAAEEGLAAVKKLLGGLKACYRCDESIDVTIGRGGKHGQGKYFVRCSCGAKHNAP